MAYIREFPPRLPPRFLELPLDGGRVQSISVNPTNNSHIIVANQFGGLWKTENGGTNWFHLDNLSAVFAIDVAYAPDGNTVIATLGRDNRVDNGGGIWVSRDGGLTWARPEENPSPPANPRTPERINAWGICYAPDEANTVYVGTDYGIAVSENNGRSWSHIMLENTSGIAPDKFQNSVYSVLALPNKVAIALCRTGVYRTNDRGTRWNLIRAGNFGMLWPFCFKNIDVSPLDSDKVFILQNYSSLFLYEVNSGAWTSIELPPVPPEAQYVRGPFVRVSRSSAGTASINIWVGQGINLLKVNRADFESVRRITATDWIMLQRPAGLHDDSGYLGLDNDKRPVLYGSDGGLFRPTNAAATEWTRAAIGDSGLNSYQITDLAGTNVGPSPTGRYRTSLYFSTQDNAIWASSDDGITWPNSDCAEGFHVEVRGDAMSDAEVTVAYGRICSNPEPFLNRLSDAHLINQRAVPDVDTAGTALSNMSQAFLISPGNWIRYRMPTGGNTEIYVSQDNCSIWRRKAIVTLAQRGVFAVSGPSSNPTIYAPFRGARTRPGGGERVGLIELTDVFGSAILNYDDRDLIYLPDSGSLGQRATEFDWQTVYGVDPTNSDYIIAPDIHNQVVMVTRDGGYRWTTDENLTKAVTRGGELLLYDADGYHMQVTHISFDPYYPNRILVGTREAGMIISEDRGYTWNTIPNSEVMLYVTGFFFKRDFTVVVSTYGRGLWKIDFNIHLGTFPSGFYCRGLGCIIRFPDDPEILRDPMDWLDKDVTIFINGRINGLLLSGKEVKQITVTPGSIFRRYVGETKDFSALNIEDSEKGAEFEGLKGCQAALENGEVIKGIILKGNEIFGIISGTEEFKDPENQRGQKDDSMTEETEAKLPYLFITTSLPMAGTPVVGQDGAVDIFATGFRFDPKADNYATVALDGGVVDKTAQVMADGSVKIELQVPEELSYGEHTLQVIQMVEGKELVAGSGFVKAAIDDFEENESQK